MPENNLATAEEWVIRFLENLSYQTQVPGLRRKLRLLRTKERGHSSYHSSGTTPQHGQVRGRCNQVRRRNDPARNVQVQQLNTQARSHSTSRTLRNSRYGDVAVNSTFTVKPEPYQVRFESSPGHSKSNNRVELVERSSKMSELDTCHCGKPVLRIRGRFYSSHVRDVFRC